MVDRKIILPDIEIERGEVCQLSQCVCECGRAFLADAIAATKQKNKEKLMDMQFKE